jgi:MoaA/NifB/PqqE/SkfB family radical SAM enzyme
MAGISEIYRWMNDLHAVIPRKLATGYAFPPMRVGCVVSHRCNLRCSMCMVWKHGFEDHGRSELTTSEWLTIFKQIPWFSIITFTGGEPLIRQDFPTLLQAACRSRRVHLVSNGTLFDDAMIERCVSLAPERLFGRGLLSVGVSLEGPAEVHDRMVCVKGAHEKTTAALRKLVALKRERKLKFPILDLKIVICRETHGSLVALYDLAEDIGLDMVSYQQCSTQESSYGIDAAAQDSHTRYPPAVEPIDRTALLSELTALKTRSLKGRAALRFNPDMPPELFADRYENKFPLKRFTCSAAWSIMHIGPYGTVFPCFSIPMGNLRSQTLSEIWNGNRYRAFRKELKSAGMFPGCMGCCVMKHRTGR